jgi:ubiquinone/menaquinone biosynthesis C-methylase UbiE
MTTMKTRAVSERVDWQSYAAVYDLMTELNPAYQELVDSYRRFLATQWLHPDDLILDLGAGTGNFSMVAADEWPLCRVLHVDASDAMVAQARRKSSALGLQNIDFCTEDVADLDLPPESAALITVVHALYSFPDPIAVIHQLFRWLTPGGTVFACDPGRPLDMREWTRYIFRSSAAERGWLETARLFWRARGVVGQNRRIARGQADGAYWRHDLHGFAEAFADAGFDVMQCRPAYRGASDLLIARKALPVAPLLAHGRALEAPL